jgi:hypothetical protein
MPFSNPDCNCPDPSGFIWNFIWNYTRKIPKIEIQICLASQKYPESKNVEFKNGNIRKYTDFYRKTKKNSISGFVQTLMDFSGVRINENP